MLTQKRPTWLVLLVLAGSIALIVATQHSSGETNVQQPQRTRIKVLRRHDQLRFKPTKKEIQDDQPPPQERFLEDKIPKQLPIKVKIKKEKEKVFKDSKNDKWARDLEIEVKNTGTKPIYYLILILNLPELKYGVSNIIFDLRFGDRKFANFAAGARTDDISLKPGETTILKIRDGNDLDWEDFSRGMHWPRPIKFELEFQELSFGDGTGFLSGATPWPPTGRNPAPGAYLKGPDKDTGKAHHAQRTNKSIDGGAWKFSSGGSSASYLPAIFLSAGFLNSVFASPSISITVPDSCCSADGCQFVHEYDDFEACYDGGCSPTRSTNPRYCFEPGDCKTVDITYRRCHVVEDGYNYWYNCPYAVTHLCSTPSPTPTPTPSPTPSPTPTDCQLSNRPNDTNCHCMNFPGEGPTWVCECPDGNQPADYNTFPQSGGCDPSKSSNNGSNCCACTNEITCEPDYHWLKGWCQCVPDIILATPTPTPVGGGSYYYANCTQYYWVLYECTPVGETDWDCREVDRWEAGCW